MALFHFECNLIYDIFRLVLLANYSLQSKETTFNAHILCESCIDEEPLFAYINQTKSDTSRYLQFLPLDNNEDNGDNQTSSSFSLSEFWYRFSPLKQEGHSVRSRARNLQGLSELNAGLYIDATEFFEEFIKTVIAKIKSLSEENQSVVGSFQEIQFAYTENEDDGKDETTQVLTVNLTQAQYVELKTALDDVEEATSEVDESVITEVAQEYLKAESPFLLYGPLAPK